MLLGLFASSCATAPQPESEADGAIPSPSVADDRLALMLIPKGPDRIELSWAHSSTGGMGYRIERRDAPEESFSERAVLDGLSTTWVDQTVSLEREYCYRVTALSGGEAEVSGVECGKTPAKAPMTCTNDPKDNRAILAEILDSSDMFWVEWREAVGLAGINPAQLELVEDDATCNALWSKATRGDAAPYELIAFFQLGNRYIVTDYINTDPSFGPIAVGEAITIVLDDQMQVILHAIH